MKFSVHVNYFSSDNNTIRYVPGLVDVVMFSYNGANGPASSLYFVELVRWKNRQRSCFLRLQTCFQQRRYAADFVFAFKHVKHKTNHSAGAIVVPSTSAKRASIDRLIEVWWRLCSVTRQPCKSSLLPTYTIDFSHETCDWVWRAIVLKSSLRSGHHQAVFHSSLYTDVINKTEVRHAWYN